MHAGLVSSAALPCNGTRLTAASGAVYPHSSRCASDSHTARPALLTVSIFAALEAWNGFLFPLVLTQSDDTRVVPFALYDFQTQFGINVPALLAAVVLSTLPVFALYLVGRRQLLGGLTAGFNR